MGYIPTPLCFIVRACGALAVALCCVAGTAAALEIDLRAAYKSRIVGHGAAFDEHPSWYNDQVTIATIAMRGYDARDLVQSLRGPGQFQGDIVVITDGCSPEVLGARTLNVGMVEGPLAAKRLKTRLFDLIAPESDTAVLFMDADIVANRAIGSFFVAVRQALVLEEHVGVETPCSAWFNRERAWQAHRQGHVWQGGFFFLPSQLQSEVVLRAWQHEIDALPPGSLDQTALVRALAKAPKELRVCKLPSDMSFVPDLWSTIWGAQRTTFTHWTKSSERRHDQGSSGSNAAATKKIRAFLRGFSTPNSDSRRPRRVEQPMDKEGCGAVVNQGNQGRPQSPGV